MENISLRAARINRGLTLRDVSILSGVSITTLAKWEKYITFPSAMQFKRLCGLYGVTMDDIFVPDELTKS